MSYNFKDDDSGMRNKVSLPAVSDTGHPAAAAAAAAVAWVPSLGLGRRWGGSVAADNREVQGRGAGRGARVLARLPESSALPLPHRTERQQPGSLTVPESPKFCDPTPPPGLSLSSQGLWRGGRQMAG